MVLKEMLDKPSGGMQTDDTRPGATDRCHLALTFSTPSPGDPSATWPSPFACPHIPGSCQSVLCTAQAPGQHHRAIACLLPQKAEGRR